MAISHSLIGCHDVCCLTSSLPRAPALDVALMMKVSRFPSVTREIINLEDHGYKLYGCQAADPWCRRLSCLWLLLLQTETFVPLYLSRRLSKCPLLYTSHMAVCVSVPPPPPLPRPGLLHNGPINYPGDHAVQDAAIR